MSLINNIHDWNGKIIIACVQSFINGKFVNNICKEIKYMNWNGQVGLIFDEIILGLNWNKMAGKENVEKN